MKKICIIPFLALFLFSCQKDNPDKDNSVVQLTTKEQAKNQSELDRYIHEKLTIPYNVNINYRYPENDINRNQFTYVVPPSTQKALEMVNLIDYMYYQPYSKVVPKKFMQEYVTKQITLIGSYAYARNGGTYNGLATAGIRLELLGVNYIEPNTHDDSKRKDMDNNLLRLIYHETSHILEQNKQIPPEYEKLCAAEYKGGSWTRSWNLSTQNYLKSGVITVIATDHAPHHTDEKNVEDITKAPSGMTGLETSLSLGLTYLVEAGELSLMELLEKMTVNPAKLYNFEAGYLAENGPADITIFDAKADRLVDSHFASKAANSPFIGETLKGQVKYTICKGQIVYKN